MNLLDMDYPEFYNTFIADLIFFEMDCERLTKMLVKGIESVIQEFQRVDINSENCQHFKREVHENLDAYNRAIEAYIFSLKAKYSNVFDSFDPEKSKLEWEIENSE